LALAFSISLRLLGLLGLIFLIKRRQYALLALVAALISYYVLVPLGVGRPRFRLPFEAPLTLLAIYGLAWIGSLRPMATIKQKSTNEDRPIA
jgi:hypothetical protein